MTSFIERLNKHQKIGIDIDATLIDGPKSRLLQEWCKDNHKTKELHLVTFRYNADFHFIGQDLIDADVDISMFRGVHGSPAELMIEYLTLVNKVGFRWKAKNEAKWIRSLAYHKILHDDFIKVEDLAHEWKGLKCKELGLTCLIDDMEESVLPGCMKHGIEFIHSLK